MAEARSGLEEARPFISAAVVGRLRCAAGMRLCVGTARAHHAFSEEGGSTVPSWKRGGPARWRPREFYRAGAAAAAETAAAAGAATTWACAPPRWPAGGHRPRAEQARGHVAGVRRLYGARMQWCRQRAGGVRWVWRRQRRIVGVPWPTPAAGLLGSLGLSMGSARVAARPSTLARL